MNAALARRLIALEQARQSPARSVPSGPDVVAQMARLGIVLAEDPTVPEGAIRCPDGSLLWLPPCHD